MMEGRSVVLAKLPSPLFEEPNVNILLSPSLRHLIIWNQNKISVYYVSKQSDYEHKGSVLIWVETTLNIDSVVFSSDGKQFGLLSNTLPKKIHLYRIAEKEVFKENEFSIGDKSNFFRSREDVLESLHSCPDSEVLVFININQVVTYCPGLLSSYNVTPPETPQTFCTTLPLDISSFHNDKQYFYCLSNTGTIYLYTLTDGNLAGIFEVYKSLPKDLQFTRLCVNSAGNEVALVTTTNHVYILNILLAVATPLPSLQQLAPSSSTSVSSFKTSTSKSSHYSRVESVKRESTNKKITLIANASSATTSWFSFLENLTNRKAVMGKVEHSNTFVCIQDIPNKYTIQSLHFCQDSLGVWATQPENTSDGFYRLYDKSSGHLESADILPPDTHVTQLDSQYVSLDLFLQGSSLYLPLGVISKDTLIQKMIGGENEIQVDEMIGHAVLPLPLLQEGLKNLQIDLVRLALNLHTQGFKSKLSEGACAVDELVESTQQLFETIHSGIIKSDGDDSWRQQVRRLALTHSNTLLSLLTCPADQTDVQIKILQHVVLLKRGEMLPSVDLPVIPQWVFWLDVPDEELILHSITSLNMVHCFLALHRGWTEEELLGQRFLKAVHNVFIGLLQEKKFSQATHLLTKVNLDPEKETTALFLQCRDPSLRDYLFTNKTKDLSNELNAAWQLLTLIEPILTTYSQHFPTFKRSPLCISDILSLSTKDRAQILADLYLLTGEPKLEGYLDKDACWTYLLRHNCTKMILSWIANESSDISNEWPLKIFSQWNIDQHLVDGVMSVDCTELTRHVVCNKFASFGILTDAEKSNTKKFLLRMAYADTFPDVNLTLDQKTANVKRSQFVNLVLSNAIQNNLVDLVVKLNLNESHSLWNPNWMKLIKLHRIAGSSWNQSDVTQAIQETTNYLADSASMESNTYLKQHPIVAVVSDILQGQNICQLHSHVSPLLAAAVPLKAPAQEDITLYSVLAHTVSFHTDNIFRHQIGSKMNNNLPDFCNENLSLHHGIYISLGFEDFLKQGRPGSALSLVLLKGKFPVRKKAAVACARGLAFCSIGDKATTSACIAFVELLGQDASQLRTQIAVARKVVDCISEQNLHVHLLQFLQGKEDATLHLLKELELFMVNRWASGDCSILDCLLEFHLSVRFCALHNLPAPESLLQLGLQTCNWLMFILPAQMYQYPFLRVQEITTSNVNCNISKHLYYALQGLTKVHKEDECFKPFEPETNLIACLSHVGNSAEMLFSLSQKLNSSVLALLGASLQTLLPAEVGLSTWLLVSLCPEDAEHCPTPPWTQDTVTQLLEEMVKKGYFYTIAQGFFIFQPVNPICALASFFIDSVVERKFKDSILSLKLFIAAMYNLPGEGKEGSTFLMSKDWISMTAYRMTCTALAHSFPSCYLKRCFLKTLCDAQFPGIIPDSKSLPLFLRLSECLAETQFQLDWERLCIHKDVSYLSELLYDLSKQHMFDVAFKFANIAGLPIDHVLVTQWSSLAVSDENKGRDFWQQCNDSFTQANIEPKTAVSFYRSQARSTCDLQERYILLKFALNWLNKSPSNKQDTTSLQFEMYMTCLEENFKIEVITQGCVITPLRCLSDSLVIMPSQSAPPLSVSQSLRLDDIIHQLLVAGDIQTAFLLQSLFHHTNQDCELLLACMRLAEGITSLTQLPTRIQEYYLAADTLRRNKITLKLPLSKRSSVSSPPPSDSQTILNTLYALQAHQTSPTTLFSNIIAGYKVSLAFNCDYKDVILDPDPLNRLLPTHSFDIATSLLNLACLTRFECTQYVCSQIVSVLNSLPVDDKYVLWSCNLESEYSCILDLSGSALLLGNSLLASDLPLSTSPLTSFRQGVELLILAHNCFTRICHMEGIESVLKLCRSLVNRLLDCCQWPLMVRLLTGIGRYTEMNYVFQILKANDQFEFLLGKGSDKLPQLMSATLEFVRHDKDLFSLVAHHFSMYSELASLYEEEAQAELGRLERTEAGDLSVTTHNKICLQAAMSKYTDATEHYIQAKKMKCGVSNVQQAELIAVQLSLLTIATDTAVPCLINLSNSEVLQLVNTVLSCEQAHIVARAYNISVDWGTALYHNCVLRGYTSYLNTWTKYHQLTKNIVQDVAHRFESEMENNPSLEMNMKWFISSVNLLDVKYRIASQLGFKDILQNLLNSPDMAYLKDTVWQSGFKNQNM